MGLKSDLEAEVAAIFRQSWSERDGIVVPDDNSLKLSNDGINLEATVLYADIADSTNLVDQQSKTFAAEIYKTFLHCAAKIIRSENGVITAYDGDRIMAIYIGGSKNTSAVRTALKIKYAVTHIINPAFPKIYYGQEFTLRCAVGVDTSNLLVARTGVRGANDLVWVGRAANYAAKLSALPGGYAYITSIVYYNINNEVKYQGGTAPNMWELVKWNTFDNSDIYRSHWWWSLP